MLAGLGCAVVQAQVQSAQKTHSIPCHLTLARNWLHARTRRSWGPGSQVSPPTAQGAARSAVCRLPEATVWAVLGGWEEASPGLQGTCHGLLEACAELGLGFARAPEGYPCRGGTQQPAGMRCVLTSIVHAIYTPVRRGM